MKDLNSLLPKKEKNIAPNEHSLAFAAGYNIAINDMRQNIQKAQSENLELLQRLDYKHFMESLMLLHGGNPEQWHRTLEKVWEESFSKYGTSPKQEEVKPLTPKDVVNNINSLMSYAKGLEKAMELDNPPQVESEKELKPCPFCQEDSCYIMTEYDDEFYGLCENCGAEGAKHSTRKGAVKAWQNRRPAVKVDKNALRRMIAFMIQEVIHESHNRDKEADMSDLVTKYMRQFYSFLEGGK